MQTRIWMRVEEVKGLRAKAASYQGRWKNPKSIYDKRIVAITTRRLMIPEEFKEKKILILGDAFGIESVHLQKIGFKNLTCTVADQREVADGLFVVCDIHKLPFGSGEYDFVYASHILEHAVAPMIALEEIYRVMKKGGRGLFWMPYHDKGQKLPYHFSCFRPYVWRDLIRKAGFGWMGEKEHEDRFEKGYFVAK